MNSPGAGFLSKPVAELPSSRLLRNIRGIIFDFDGTLFDNSLIPFYLTLAYPPDLLRLWKERLVRKYFAGCDYTSPEEYYKAFFKVFGKVCLRSSKRISAWYFNRFMPRMVKVLKKHYRARPGAIELFRRFNDLANGRTGDPLPPEASNFPPGFPKVAVYSDYPSLKERMEALGIIPDPQVLLYGPESFGAQKPAARPFRRIAGDLGVVPEEMLVIGDREDTDGLGAFKAGMRFFCLETGHKRYFRLDPYRSPKMKIGERKGPSLLMYAGTWDELIELLMEKYG